VDRGHNDPDGVAYLKDGQWVHALVPGDLRSMDEAVGDADIDEQAEAGHVGHGPVENVADLQLRGRLRLALPAQLLSSRLLRQDQPIALLVDLDDLQRQV